MESITATATAVTPPSLNALNVDAYQVTYIPSAPPCKLASFQEAYAYTILAEDYMAQVNLVSTIGASDPKRYYEERVKPRQSEDMKVVAPSVGLELSGEEVEDLFVFFSKRELAYHIWAMPRVCHLDHHSEDGSENGGDGDDGGIMRVFLRETGLVQNDARDAGEDGVEGYGEVFTVFTTIELDFDAAGKVTRLVSVRDETLLGNQVFEGNAPREPPAPAAASMDSTKGESTTLEYVSSGDDDVDAADSELDVAYDVTSNYDVVQGDDSEMAEEFNASISEGAPETIVEVDEEVVDSQRDDTQDNAAEADTEVEPSSSSSPSKNSFHFIALRSVILAGLVWTALF